MSVSAAPLALRLGVALVVSVLALLAVVPDAHAQRAFERRFPASSAPPLNARGDIVLLGNVNLHCPPGTTACTTAQNGGTGRNNSFTMSNVDVDADASTFNSSTATLALPAGTTVEWAGLYWSGSSSNAARNQVRLRTPASGGYLDLTATQLDAIGNGYQGFRDITLEVLAAGNGAYTVANVTSSVASGTWGGWTMVVVYRDPSRALRSLSVFDGLQLADGANPQIDIQITGLLTPATGPVNSAVGVVTYDGDRAILDASAGTPSFLFGPDAANLSAISNAVNPVDDIWNSSHSAYGVDLTAGRNPSYSNLLGVDIDLFEPQVLLPNNATGAYVRVRGNSGDVNFPGVITVATDVFLPDIKADLLKSSVDVNGGELEAGDVIEYRVRSTNTGTDIANQMVLRDAIPAGTTYLPGSLSIAAGANAGPKTDATGDDQVEYDAGNNRIVARLGAGANASAGGSVAPGEAFELRFRVTVDAIPGGTVIQNSAQVTYVQATLGNTVTDTSDADPTTPGDQPTRDTVAGPDLAMAKTQLDALAAGGSTRYSLVVSNTGTVPARGTATVTDTLPAGLVATAADGAGWSCSLGATVTCTRADELAAGASWPAIELTASVDPGASGTITNTATVSHPLEDPLDDANNTGSVGGTVRVAPVATADAATVGQGATAVIAVLGNDTPGSGGLALDPGSVVITVAPGQGTATVNPDGTITYVADPTWSGPVSLTYTVCDIGTPAACASATVSITIPANVPVVTPDVATTPQNTPVTIPVLGNDSSPGAPLDPSSVRITTPPGTGTATVNPDGSIGYVPAPGYSGPVSFEYEVCDTSTPTAVCVTATVTLTVEANTPVATPDVATTPQNTPVTIPVLGNDSSPGAPLDPSSVRITTPPGTGTATVNPDGTIGYVPAPGYSGPVSFEYEVCDTSTPTAVCVTATVTLTVEANTPVATPDVATTPQNTPVTIPVLGNDSSPGAPLDPSSVRITTPPGTGTATVNPDGTIGYVPAPGYSGPVSFEYEVCDTSTPTAVCVTATVTLTVEANTPVATPDVATTPQNTPVTIPVLGNDSSPGAPLDPSSVRITTPPGTGTATVNPDGTIGYVPAPGYSGPVSFEYEVCDTSTPTAVCVTATVTLTVEANTPVATPDVATTPQNTPVTIPVLGNDSSPGAPLDPSSVRITTPPGTGTATVNPDGTIGYVPAPGYSGPVSFEYEVCDTSTPTAVCVTATVTLTVEANTPVATPDVATTPQNTPVTIPVLGNDSSPGAPLDPSSVRITTPPGTGTATVNPDGTIGYVPAPGYSGPVSFEYEVCDTSTPTSVCVSTTVTLTVEANTVTARDDAARTPQNTPVNLLLLDNDGVAPGGAALVPATLRVIAPPAHGQLVVNADGSVTYTPDANYAGPDQIEYEICDASTPTAVCARAIARLQVEPGVVIARDDSAATPGTAVTLPVLGNDSASGAALAPGSVRITTPPSSGTAVANPDGSLTYTPAAGFSGTVSLVYEVCDVGVPTPSCASATVTIVVTAPATGTGAVIAADDAASTGPGQPVRVDVLLNDSTAGSPLDPASLRLVTAPSHGVVVINADGTATYTPAPGYSGPDSFEYEICDRTSPVPACDRAIATITVRPAVVIANDDAARVDGVPVTVNVLGNDSGSATPLVPGSVRIITPPGLGTAVVLADGRITYTPGGGAPANDLLEYEVCDASTPTPVCARAWLRLLAEPGRVQAVDDIARTPQDTAVVIAVANNDVAGAGRTLSTALRITTPPVNGSVVVLPDGTVRYTPAPGFSGEDTFNYEICDDATPVPACDIAIVRIVVEDTIAPPVAVDDTGTSPTPGSPVSLPALANDLDNGGGLVPGSVRLIGTAGPGVSLVVPGEGTWSIDPTTGVITFTPEPGFTADPTPVQYVVRNTQGELSNPATLRVDYAQDDGVVVAKQASPRLVRAGDLVRYVITVRNTGNTRLRGVEILDAPPAGFRLVAESLRVADADGAGSLLGVSPIRIGGIDVDVGQTATVVYLMRVGAAAGPGEQVNRARAWLGPDPLSEEATATVTLQGDALLEDALVLGTVYDDRDGDGWQDSHLARGLVLEATGHRAELGDLPARAHDAAEAPAVEHVLHVGDEALARGPLLLRTADGLALRVAADGATTLERSGAAARGEADPALRVERVVEASPSGWRVLVRVHNTSIAERGLPGVRLATVEGLVMHTDARGRYHLVGLDGGPATRGRHLIVKLDEASLPEGAVITTRNPLVRRVTPGLPVRFDFGVRTVAPSPAAGEARP